MSNKKKNKRICGKIDQETYDKFKASAIQMYGWERGYTQNAVEHSVKTFIWVVEEFSLYHPELRRIGEGEFGHLSPGSERRKAMIKEALCDYIKKKLKNEDNGNVDLLGVGLFLCGYLPCLVLLERFIMA